LGIWSWTTLGAFSDHLDGRMSSRAPIVVVTKRLPPTELAKFIGHPFPDMVKFVVDLRSRVMAMVVGSTPMPRRSCSIGQSAVGLVGRELLPWSW